MGITLHTDYAFRVLMYLGTCSERRVTIKEVAERFDISRSHLMKVVTALVDDFDLFGHFRLDGLVSAKDLGETKNSVERRAEFVAD